MLIARHRRDQNGSTFLWAIALVFVLLAFFMRVHRLESVPPGVHYDEILNGEIAEEALREGPKYFYDHSGGREGLYHFFLAGSFGLPLPVVWQLRLPSIVLSLFAIAFSYFWVTRTFGRWAGVTILGLMAVSFWTVWMARAALRVGIVTPVAALSASLLLLLLKADSQRIAAWLPKSLALGIVLGLSFYTYRAGSMVFVLYCAFAVYLLLWHRREVRKLVPAILVALIIALPILLLFATQPEADPRFGQIALPWHALLEGDPVPALRGALQNAGMFFWEGDHEGHYNLPGRPHFGPIGGVLFLTGLAISLWRWRRPMYALCLLWLGVGLLPGIFTLPAPSFVHTVSAQGVTYAFPAIAVSVLVRKFPHERRRASTILAAFVLLFIILHGLWTYRDYFERWPEVDEVRAFHQTDLALIASDLDDQAETHAAAICSSVLNEDDSFWRSGRQSIRFMLDRDDVRIRWYDCRSAYVLPGGVAHVLYYFPDDTAFGEWIGRRPATLDEQNLGGGVRLVIADVAALRESLLEDLTVAGNQDVSIQFGDEMRFVGYRLERNELEPGGEITLLTFWEVSAPLPPDLSVFVHVQDQEGTLITQGDAFSVLSDTLTPGDLVIQLHRFAVPDDAGAGEYSLSIGVYSRTGARPPLPITSGGHGGELRLPLETLEVREPR